MPRKAATEHEDDDVEIELPAPPGVERCAARAVKLFGFRSPNTGTVVLLCGGCRKNGVGVPGYIYSGAVETGRCRNCRAEL